MLANVRANRPGISKPYMQQEPSNSNVTRVKFSAAFITRVLNVGFLVLDQVQSCTCLSFLPQSVCLAEAEQSA